jgi:hypothetical protein
MKKSYKPFKQYIDAFVKWVGQISNKFMVRLYIDESILQEKSFDVVIEKDFENLEIFQYVDERFLEDDKVYHDGTFGSIIRLIPLFQKPKNVKYIWVTDLDMPVKVYNYKYIKLMLNKNVKVMYYSKACYNKPWSQGLEYPIGAGRIIMNSKINLDYKNFTRFLNDVLKNKYKPIYEEIKEKYEAPVKGLKRKMSDVKYFPYGFDELFCNLYLLPVFETYKHIIFFDIGLRAFIDEKITKISNNKEYTGLYFKSWATNINVKDYKKLINTTHNIYESVKDTPLDPESYLNSCRDDYKKHYKTLFNFFLFSGY